MRRSEHEIQLINYVTAIAVSSLTQSKGESIDSPGRRNLGGIHLTPIKLMKKNSGSFRNSGTFTNPGTPEHGDINVVETSKGWSSERVVIRNSSISRRHISSTALIPFNSGRALPSKWDDAERWIASPVSGHESCKTVAAEPRRQPKSKSGPLGSRGLVHLSNYSPSLGAKILKNLGGNSSSHEFSSYDAGVGVNSSYLYCENTIARSTSVPGLSNFLGETSVPSLQDIRLDDGTEEEDGVVSCRDMATHMSPEGSVDSCSKETFLSSILPSSSLGPNMNPSAKDAVRDVQVDKSTSADRQFKKHGQRNMENPKNVRQLSSTRSVTDESKNVKLLREEAKISAWENLQKAKADAAIKKLEMKLEKKRSVSMDKILNKLRASQMKAEDMRKSILSQTNGNPTRRYFFLSFCGIFANLP